MYYECTKRLSTLICIGEIYEISKYLFYVIYPIHLWILEIVRNLIIP